MNVHRAALAAACILPTLITGCAGINEIGTGGGPIAVSAGTLSGTAHGGFQPISGAVVTLYQAGTAGYGVAYNSGSAPTGAKAIAHVTTGPDGSFSFSKQSTSQANDNTSATYSCPVASDPQMYLVARGGNTSGALATDPTLTGNSASALTVALGSCSEGSHSVKINEATTVATVFAMQQFMSVTPSDIFIGAPNTTSASQGLANAYTSFAKLVDPATGAALTTLAPTSTAAGVAMTGIPEYQKLNTLANILATCVNQGSYDSSASTASCNKLFANAVPPIYQTTNQVVSSYVAATDTAMAAYYLAVNPTQAQDGTTTRMHALYTLPSGTKPFMSDLSDEPLDWTLGVAYTAGTSTCTGANSAKPFVWPTQLAIDSASNIWITNGGNSGVNAVVEVAQTGGVSKCLDGTFVYGNALVIDKNDNVWYTVEGSSASAGVLMEYTAAGNSVPWPVATNYQPYALTTTPAGDIIMTGYGTGTYVPQIYSGAASATAAAPAIPASSTPAGGRPTSLAATFYPSGSPTPYLFAPGSSSVYVFAPADSGTYPYTYSGNIPSIESYTSLIASDREGKIVGASEAGTASPLSTWYKVTPGTAAGTLSPQFLGGLNYPSAVAVDGVNNYWASLRLPTSSAGAYGIAEIRSDMTTALSPTGTTPTSCVYNSGCVTEGSFQRANVAGSLYDLAIDSSGNVWAVINSAVTGGSPSNGLVEVVGAAAPVVTPLVNFLQQ